MSDANSNGRRRYSSQIDQRTDTPGVYRRNDHYRVLTRPDGKRKVMRRFDTYEEAVAFKAQTPDRHTAKRRGRTPLAKYARKGLVYLRADPCAYCGGPCEHIDHIVPSSRGGPDDWENLTASCQRCNLAKGTTSLLLFLLEAEPTLSEWRGVVEVSAKHPAPLFALLGQ